MDAPSQEVVSSVWGVGVEVNVSSGAAVVW